MTILVLITFLQRDIFLVFLLFSEEKKGEINNITHGFSLFMESN